MLAALLPWPRAAAQASRLTEQFTTPDGSRFVLVRDPGRGEVNWSIASWADGRDDPEGLPGLTSVVLRTSLNGTFTIGSTDAAAEREVLQQLDTAWHEQLASPNDARRAAHVVQLDQRAAELGDVRTFRRLLAAAPAHAPDLQRRGPVAVLTLTTIESALPEVGRLLFERREHQALRRLAREWEPNLRELTTRLVTDRELQLDAEALALCMPFSPTRSQLQVPPLNAPTRAEALACWSANQHPSRCVHVLLGDLDLERTRKLLTERFARTGLPTPPPAPATAPRPTTAQRSSRVPGMPRPSLTLVWPMPPLGSPWPIDVASRWLAGGADFDGALQRRLARQRPGATVRVRAPWPRTENGRSLFLLQVHDPSGKPKLREDVLRLTRELASDEQPDREYAQANRELQREWQNHTAAPRTLAAVVAEYALLWPDLPPQSQPPGQQQGPRIRAVLQAIVGGHPAVVEGER